MTQTIDASPVLSWLEAWLEAHRKYSARLPALERPFRLEVGGKLVSCVTNGNALLAASVASDYPRIEDHVADGSPGELALKVLRGVVSGAKEIPARATDLDAFREWLGAPVAWEEDEEDPPEGFVRPGWIYGQPFDRNLVAGVLEGIAGPIRIGSRSREATYSDGRAVTMPELYVLGGSWMALVLGLDPSREAIWGGLIAPRWPVEG